MYTRYAIILCGGAGTRLWPLSRAMMPKQLLALNGEETLLQQTAKRLCQHISPKNLITVTHQDHKFEVIGQLAKIFPDAIHNVLSEPCARNTLPAIAWAVTHILSKDSDALIGVFASDHAIDDETAFLNAWRTAELSAESGYLTLLGITPQEPANGYGYIKPAEAIHITNAEYPVLQVAEFVEKPTREVAEQFVADGYLWNSGMFVFKAESLMQMLQQYQPTIYEQIMTIDKGNVSAEAFVKQYAELPNISMDHGIAEKAEKVAVVPVSMEWSDLGNWESIYQKQHKNAQNNVIHGTVLTEDTHNSLLWTEHGLLATMGVSNVAIIQTADATLVCDRSRAEDIKQLVANVRNKKSALTETHLTVHRPWGSYAVLEESTNFKIKRIMVNPGAKLSMQMHHHRSEHWVVVSGIAKVTNGENEIVLHENESTYIPKNHRHRLENVGLEQLSIIEVQCGEYVGEDDIVRFDDHYGRC